MSPVNDSVSVAVVSPAETLDTPEMETFGMVVTSSKPEAVTPDPYPEGVSTSLTSIVAVFRAASVRTAGPVAAISARG